jgi:hypothetical protein
MRHTTLRLGYLFHKLLRRWFPRRDRDMEQRCTEAFKRGEYKPLSEVIAELKAKTGEANRP